MVAAAVEVPIQQPAPIRQATPERWQRASERAKVANVTVTLIEAPDLYQVSSASYPGITYECTTDLCTCQAAGHGDPVCLHRAAVRDHLAEQEPCRTCGGTGWDYQAIWDWRSGCSITIFEGPCHCTAPQSSEPESPAPLASELAMQIARAYAAETELLCAAIIPEQKQAIRAAYGIPETCTASPERIGELQRRLDDGIEAIGQAVRELEEAGYFDRPGAKIDVALDLVVA